MTIKNKLLHRLNMVYIELELHKRRLSNNRIPKKLRFKYLISVIARRCENKGVKCSGGKAYIQHSNCAYIDKVSNYYYCCFDCHEQIYDMYQEMWDDLHPTY